MKAMSCTVLSTQVELSFMRLKGEEWHWPGHCTVSVLFSGLRRTHGTLQ